MDKYIFQCNNNEFTDEVYYDSDRREVVMVGELGEQRISLHDRLAGSPTVEHQAIITAAFLFAVEQYIELQLDGEEEYTDPMPQVQTEIEFEYEEDEKFVGAGSSRNKKDEMN